MKKTLFTLFILFFTNGAFAQFSTDANKILYVDSAVVGGNGSGDSWANAAVSLADALSWARTNETNWASDSLRIYVAKGTYLPKYKADDNTWSANNRDNAFVMIKNVQVYGGFPNGGSAFAARDWNANPTVMSGDIGTVGNTSDNAYHVIVVADNAGNACADGFVVKEGRADGSGPITVNSQSVDRGVGGGLVSEQSNLKVSNTIFTNNYAMHGGGYLTNASTFIFTNCKIKNNTTQYNGAGGYNNASTAQFVNTELTSNTSSAGNGGAFFNYSNSTVKLTNCLVAKNNALDGGGFYNLNTSSATLVNVTLADNTPNAYTLENSSSLTAKNSIVLGGKSGNANPGTYQNSYVNGVSWNANWGTNGGSNIVSTDDPFFNKVASDYRLSPCTPAIDAGSNTLYTGEGGNLSTDKDIAGNNRVFNTTIDMGAYENVFSAPNLGADDAYCAGTPYSNTLDVGNIGSSYLWSDGSTGQTFTISGSGTYWIAVTYPNGCVNADTITVVENALPVVNLGADAAYCAGTSYSNVLDAGNSGSTYLWNDNTTNQTLNVTASGTYSVTVTDGNGCANADTITVIENALPIITVTQNGNELTADESAAGTAYLWIDCDNNNTPVIEQTHQQFTPTQNGNYAVVVTSQAGCSDTSACIPVTNVGVNENVKFNGVSVYPNPTSGSITVNTDKIYENLTVKISDVSGKVLSIETVQNTQKVLVNMNGSKGVYFVHIYSDKEMLSVQRVIKD